MDDGLRRSRRSGTALSLGIAMAAAGCMTPGDGAFMSMVSGSFLQDEGNLVDAEKAYLHASRSPFLADEMRTTVRAALAELYKDQGRWDEAAALTEQLIAAERAEGKGSHAGSVRLLAEIRWQQGRAAEARRILAAAIDEFPGAKSIYLADLAEFRRREGRCDDALQLLHAAMAHRPSVYVEERLAPLLVEMGRTAQAADVYADMELRIRQGVRLPSDLDYRHGAGRLAELLEDRGRVEEALAVRMSILDALESSWPADRGSREIDEARRRVRDDLLRLGRHSEAEQLYLHQPALKTRVWIAEELIEVYTRAGKLVEAEALARSILDTRTSPPPPKAAPRTWMEWLDSVDEDREQEARDERLYLARDQARLARVLLAAGRTGEAEDLARSSLRGMLADLVSHHPRVAEAMELLALVLREGGRAEEAGALETQAAAIRRLHARGPSPA